MALRLKRGGVADPRTDALVGFWPDAAGTYTITLGGQSVSVNVPSVAANAGCTHHLFTGLTPGASYECVVTGPSEVARMTVRTVPANGAHKTLVTSCLNSAFSIDQAVSAMLAEHADQVCLIGDAPYIDDASAAGQYSTSPTDTTLRRQHQRFLERWPMLGLYQSGNVVQCPSDHDYLPGNDAPGRDDNSGGAGVGSFTFNGADACNAKATVCTSETAWRTMITNNRGIWLEFNKVPPNPEAGQTFGGGPVPADAEYTRWTVGRVEYFQVDPIYYSDYRANTADTDRTMLGAVQLAWLIARIKASAAPFKVVLFPHELLKKDALSGTTRSDYGHINFSDERDALIAAFTDFTGWAVPGGLVLLTGDVHSPTVYEYTAGQRLLQVTGCPGGTDFAALTGLGTTADADIRMLWWEQYPASGLPRSRYYSMVQDTGDGPLVVSLKDCAGTSVYSAQIVAGSNAPTYPRRLQAR